jgi:putative SOS response-associated peptidase YedK
MCGRYTLTITDIATLAHQWGAEVEAALLAGWRPRFNVAPGDQVPLLIGAAGQRRLIPAAFGLAAPGGGLLLNARQETVARKASFRAPLQDGRAAVPCDGFFEWEGPPSARRPSWFHAAGQAPFLLAALSTEGAGGTRAFCILTTEAVAPVARLHDRMPVVLPPEQVDAWLAGGPPPALAAARPGALLARLVSPRVNAPRNDDPACLEPPPEPLQRSLFGS